MPEIAVAEILDDRFEVLAHIGSGGVSTVYRARDRTLEREVALKVLHPHLADRELLVKQFEREIAITRTVDHPGIAKYYELHDTGARTYLVLEYLPGGE